MPVGRLSALHALIGGTTAALLWELIRHALGWYFSTLSQVSVVYGSITTTIIVLLSLEVARRAAVAGRTGDRGIRKHRDRRGPEGAGADAHRRILNQPRYAAERSACLCIELCLRACERVMRGSIDKSAVLVQTEISNCVCRGRYQ